MLLRRLLLKMVEVSSMDIGLLCSICRENFSKSDHGSLCTKNVLVIINVPRSAPFVSIREILKNHEFGEKMKGDLCKTGPV
jgi:hypothetical protein